MNTHLRIKWLDAARTCAILLVLLCHVTSDIYSIFGNTILNRSVTSQFFAFFSFTLGRLGVPIFYLSVVTCYYHVNMTQIVLWNFGGAALFLYLLLPKYGSHFIILLYVPSTHTSSHLLRLLKICYFWGMNTFHIFGIFQPF